MRILVKIYIGITCIPTMFAMLMIFPCLGFGIIFLLADILMYLSWPFTGHAPWYYNGLGAHDTIFGFWLPLYIFAVSHFILAENFNIPFCWPINND